jgi:aspartyl-tRNA synthetase
MVDFSEVRPCCLMMSKLISRRASENLHFFTLRDSTSSIQLVSRDKALSEELMSAPLESVVQIEGVVKGRKAKSKSSSAVTNPVSRTGDVKDGTDGVAR